RHDQTPIQYVMRAVLPALSGESHRMEVTCKLRCSDCIGQEDSALDRSGLELSVRPGRALPTSVTSAEGRSAVALGIVPTIGAANRVRTIRGVRWIRPGAACLSGWTGVADLAALAQAPTG